MSRYVFKMPDLGEGTVEAEIVACHVKPGDWVKEEQVILEVMTEKASVEVNSPVSGRIVSIAGEPGRSIPVGAELIVFDVADDADESPTPVDIAPAEAPADIAADIVADVVAAEPQRTEPAERISPVAAPGRNRVMASPATRRRAKEAGVDLSTVPGSGPGGRIERDDLARFISERTPAKEPAARTASTALRQPSLQPQNDIEEIPVIGIRRLIAQRMTETVRTIPHFSYVEEIDVTELESLRQHLNSRNHGSAAPLTYLPFLGLALAQVLPQFPQCNVRYDAERELLLRHRSLHLGIATQTASGLKVPVVRNVQRHSLYELAAEIRRVSDAARGNKASREELSGSTLTLTSLGKLGGIASTPIINSPEVCIIGINKAVDRPVVKHGVIVVRRMMNISASFDHRFVDGHDAASLVQALKDTLEHTALIFSRIESSPTGC